MPSFKSSVLAEKAPTAEEYWYSDSDTDSCREMTHLFISSYLFLWVRDHWKSYSGWVSEFGRRNENDKKILQMRCTGFEVSYVIQSQTSLSMLGLILESGWTGLSLLPTTFSANVCFGIIFFGGVFSIQVINYHAQYTCMHVCVCAYVCVFEVYLLGNPY